MSTERRTYCGMDGTGLVVVDWNDDDSDYNRIIDSKTDRRNVPEVLGTD